MKFLTDHAIRNIKLEYPKTLKLDTRHEVDSGILITNDKSNLNDSMPKILIEDFGKLLLAIQSRPRNESFRFIHAGLVAVLDFGI